jgi:hypothetical protein
MITDLMIAWLFWLVIRWPILQGQVCRLGVRVCRRFLQIPQKLRRSLEELRRESELARRRELRAAGLAE